VIFKDKILVLVLLLIFCVPDFAFGQPDLIKEKIRQLKEVNKEIALKKGEICNNIILAIPSAGINEGKNIEYAPLISEILKLDALYPEMWLDFVYTKRVAFNSSHISEVRTKLKKILSNDDYRYNELIYFYGLKNLIPTLEQSIDHNLLDTVQYFIDTEQRLPKVYKIQLRNMATLANLGDEMYEDELLELVKNTYSRMEHEYETKHSNILRAILYTDIIPNTLKMLYSKKSTMNSLFLLKNSHVDPGIPYEVPPTIYSKMYYDYFLSRRIHISLLPDSLVEKYKKNYIVNDIGEWEEALSKDEIWRSIVDY